MTLFEFKTELFDGIKLNMPDYSDVVFRDDNGDVLNWAISEIENAPDTLEQAMQERGIGIIVCDLFETRNLNAVGGNFVRIASYPVIIAGNPKTTNAPILCNVVSDIETAISRIGVKNKILGQWRVGTTKSSVTHNNCYIINAEHNYTK